jgi:Domain of unknown function (DUF4124)
MMRTLLFTLMCLACGLAFAATVYRWVDENGTVHYSDQPHANAEKLQVQAAQTYPSNSSPYAAAAAASGGAPPPPSADTEYRGCAIADPQDGATFANLDVLNVAVRTDPMLHAGDQIYILLDGTAVNGGNATGSQFSISPVERGSHTLQAQVKDGHGNIMCQTPPVSFESHQNSILNPNNTNIRPH